MYETVSDAVCVIAQNYRHDAVVIAARIKYLNLFFSEILTFSWQAFALHTEQDDTYLSKKKRRKTSLTFLITLCQLFPDI